MTSGILGTAPSEVGQQPASAPGKINRHDLVDAHHVGNGWSKSTFSISGTACVEVKPLLEHVLVRDSKFRPAYPGESQPIARVSRSEWMNLVRNIQADLDQRLFELPGDGTATLASHGDEESLLSFTPDEWLAFVKGVANGEFDLAVHPERLRA